MITHELETGQTVMVAVVPRTATSIRLEPPYLRYSNMKDVYLVDKPIMIEPNMELIGTIQHPGVFSFDPEPFVAKVFAEFTPGFPEIIGYKNYMDWDSDSKVDTPDLSFLSRLASWGYCWDNPLGAPETDSCKCTNSVQAAQCGIRCPALFDNPEWQEAESRKLSVDQMVVLIQAK